jgi:hypothetical protein
MYPPRIRATQTVFWALRAGVFTGGGGLMNQLNKVAIGVDTTCSAAGNSGSETNVQSAVALNQHAYIFPDDRNKSRSVLRDSHLVLCEEVVS